MELIFDIVELLKIILLSIIQGITEWLPISSTGHMILVEEIFTLNTRPAFTEMFFVLVQLGSIFAVIILYFNKLNPLSFKKTSQERKDTWMLWFKVAVGTIPVIVFGFALEDIIYENFYNPWVVAIALIVYGIIFIWVENSQKAKHSFVVKNFNDLSFRQAFLIGCFQSLAIIPGTSRSGSTIIGGLLLGTTRFIATEFSFFLSIPVMFGASLLRLIDFGFDFTQAELTYLLTGMIVAFLVSLFAIRFLMDYLKRNDFKFFGYYRIALGSIVILYFLFNRQF